MQYKITRKQLLTWDPCCRDVGERYCDENLDVLFSGEQSIGWTDILALGIPVKDKIWLATRPGALPYRMQKQFVNVVVDRAVRKCCLNCSIESVEIWAASWLDGTDKSYSSATRAANAAYSAACNDTTKCSAVCATNAATTAAALDVVGIVGVAYAGETYTTVVGATNAAAASTNYANAGAAATTEREQQLEDLRKLIVVELT